MNADSGVELSELRVDGGMTANEFLMRFQADILGVPVIRPKVVETTALGAAYAAGIAVGFWSGERDVDNWAEDKRWLPSMEPAEVDRQIPPVEEGCLPAPSSGLTRTFRPPNHSTPLPNGTAAY